MAGWAQPPAEEQVKALPILTELERVELWREECLLDQKVPPGAAHRLMVIPGIHHALEDLLAHGWSVRDAVRFLEP